MGHGRETGDLFEGDNRLDALGQAVAVEAIQGDGVVGREMVVDRGRRGCRSCVDPLDDLGDARLPILVQINPFQRFQRFAWADWRIRNRAMGKF